MQPIYFPSINKKNYDNFIKEYIEIYDQKPNQLSGVTGGLPKMIETIARAGVVNNVDGIFIETHFDPRNAKSDGANMLNLSNLEKLLTNLLKIRKIVNNLD